jgi:hypothetical protein
MPASPFVLRTLAGLEKSADSASSLIVDDFFDQGQTEGGLGPPPTRLEPRPLNINAVTTIARWLCVFDIDIDIESR